MNYASVLLKTSDIRQDTFCNLINEREREGGGNDHYTLYQNIKDDQSVETKFKYRSKNKILMRLGRNKKEG